MAEGTGVLKGRKLAPTGQPGADSNGSPVFKLYQGYRKVRNPGRADLYMGYWDTAADKPKRISRGVEEELYEKFKARLPGFYDDGEWWKLVEQADQRPLDPLSSALNVGPTTLRAPRSAKDVGTY